MTLAMVVAMVLGMSLTALTPPAQAATRHPYLRFSGTAQIGQGWGGLDLITPGDWDRNGYDDLMMVDRSGALWFYPGDGPNSFGKRRQIGHGWGAIESIRGGADWDRDGDMDLLARLPSGELRLYAGNGSGGFAGSRKIGHGWQGFSHWTVLDRSIGGYPAIVATTPGGRMSLYPTVRGRFSSARQVGHGWGSMRIITGPADWDKDGYSDLIAVDGANRLLLYSAKNGGTRFSSWQIGNGWGGMTQVHPVEADARSVRLWAVDGGGRLFNYTATYSGVNSAWVPPIDSVKGAIPATASGSLTVVSQSMAGTGTGANITYSVQVESGLPIIGSTFADQVHTILNDPRGWPRNFIQTRSRASIRIILAAPATVDRLCAPLPTNGYTSCRRGSSVIINADRWANNAAAFRSAGGSLTVYRQYLINHEVGHALGNGHQSCSRSGALAPVMQQQTLTVAPCRVNGWPNP
ncbi:MAG: DUF3152 domain-containing protein [Beutenbergiaceae bacterium]